MANLKATVDLGPRRPERCIGELQGRSYGEIPQVSGHVRRSWPDPRCHGGDSPLELATSIQRKS